MSFGLKSYVSAFPVMVSAVECPDDHIQPLIKPIHIYPFRKQAAPLYIYKILVLHLLWCDLSLSYLFSSSSGNIVVLVFANTKLRSSKVYVSMCKVVLYYLICV